MKKLAAVLAALPVPALAHPGHYAEAAGHSHWLALGALALAGAITGVALIRAARKRAASKATKPETR